MVSKQLRNQGHRWEMEFYLAGILILIMSAAVCDGAACSSVCSCYTNSYGLVAYCYNMNLGYIPTDLPNTTYSLYLQSNNIPDMKVKLCDILPNLKELVLSYNRIAQIPDGYFEGCDKLTTFNIRSNVLTYINENTFTNMTKLQILDLGANIISSIHEKAFSGMVSLQTLDLGANIISSIHEKAFSGMVSLQTLSLDANKIASTDLQWLHPLRELMTLNLAGNKLTILNNLTFSNCTKIQSLYLNDNTLNILETSIFLNLTKLELLHLHNNPLSGYGYEHLHEARTIRELRLDGTRYSTSDVFVGKIILKDMPLLRNLQIGKNSIQSLEDDFFMYTSAIEYFYCDNNELTEISPKLFRNLSELYRIDLQNNKILVIRTGTFVNMPRLYTISLYRNQIQTIEEYAFVNLTNLRELYLYDNSIFVIDPKMTSSVPNLSTLYLYSNKIQAIEQYTFVNMTNLYYLFLYNNNISDLKQNSFVNLRGLRYLRLQNNKLTVIKQGLFYDMDNLYELNLNSNNISLIESDAFGKNPSLQYLYMTSNPLKCDCGIVPFWSWLLQRPILGTSTKCRDGTYVLSISGLEIDKCNSSTCRCYNGGICTLGVDRKAVCTCVGVWKGEKCLESQCLSYDCGKDSCYVEPVNGSAKCFPSYGFCPNTTTELSTQTTTSSSGPTTPPPCTGVGNRTNKVLGESCGQHGVDGICIVAFSACMQSSSDTGWKCRCAQGYAQTSTSCVSRPNVLFSSQEPYKWIIPTSKTSNVTLNLTAVDGFQTSNPTASLTGEGASYFTVTASRTNVILSVTRSPDKSNYTLVLTASVTIDEIVIREFKEIIISVSQSLITKDIIILDGTPKGSVVGELCKFCSTGSDLCSISSTNIPIIINEEGIIETTNLINLNVIQNIQTVAYSTIIQVTKRTGLIANLTIFVVRTRYTTTLPEDSTLQTQVGRMNLVQLFRILPNENLIVDGDSIKLTRQLNYEVEPYFEKIFTLAVNGTTSHEFDILLTIRVQDVNDNAPSFSAPTYTFKAVKSAYKDIVVGVTKAIDADSNSQLKYVVSPNNILSIDNYGVIKIAEPISQTNYMATVTVSDGFFTTNSSISVEFYQHINVNLNRTFNASVPENTVVQNIISVSDINYENYQFTDQSANKDFVIDQIMGTIRNTRMFDRENEQERQFKYAITATKKNEASCSLVIIGEITIRVTDVNDEPPVFVNTPYNASVQEEQAGKQLMMNFPISTTDKDLNSVVSYSVLSPSNFTINSTTGVISTSLAIDRETTSSILVKIIANDTVNSATASVTVIVLDINDNPPYFTAIAYNYSIPEDYGIGNTVGIVTANDRDSGKNAEITFALKSDGEFFMINQTTGRITVAKELDRETTEIHLLTVYARDNGDQIKSASTTATITLTDVNDNSPRFESNRITVTFDEDKSCSSPILTVVATDADKSNTPNSQIKYSIISGGENFLLGEQTGILRCINTLDYEKNSTFILLIKAEDNGANKLSSNQTVVINVSDINDNPPEFINPKAELIIRYYSQVSRVIEKFDVIDKDTGENGRLTMTLGGDAANFLVIDKDGLLRTKAQSNPSNILYSLTIIANDNGVPPLSTNYTVNVTVSPDTSPAVSFTAQEINMTLTENTVENTMIGNISANILQNGIRLRYLIINADVENKFRLNNLTGIITNKERVDREQKDIYEFVVRAENINISSQSDLALVRVKILDVNDNPPVFTAASYFYTISENNPVQTTVNQTTKIVATDADIDVNAIIRFEIFDAGECISKFALKDAGEVSTTSIVLDQTIDYEKHKLCKLTLKAYNPNNPAMSSTVNIDINILDYNDNPPEFLDNTGNVYMVSIPEDTTINTKIPVFGRLQDRDSRENSDIVLSAFNSDCIFDVRNDNNTIKLDLRSNVHLDYESKTTLFTCNIKAQDKGSPVLSATATLNISITDVNDNAPNVMNPSINTNVSRFEDINKIIGQIQATDADSGENRRLTYSLQDSEYSSKFKIDPHTGNISINAPLIFVQTDQITIRVIVSDNGSPRLSAYAIVNVKINDDNARPYFKQQETTSIFEEMPLKDGIITQVQAYDKVNGREVICDCTYRMDTLRNDIIIDNVTGTIKFRNINGSFDRESEWNSRVDVNVIARDKDNPPKDSNVMTVTIYIKDINDNFPVFRQQDYNFSVFQKAPDGTPIGKVTAEDKDEDPKTVYSIQITGDWGSTVSINESTGVITKSGNMSLNQIQNAEIKGYVIAKDNKDPTKPPVPCLITITIEYDDKNNHTPTFEKGQYEFDLTWDTEAGYSITQLIAKDADSGREGVLSYTIVGGDDRGFFRIGPDDGRLTLAFKLDNSIGTANVIKVNLTVRANDHGILPKSSTTTVIITISGQNPGLCVQGAAHQKRVTSLEDERDNWSKALYALVAGLCVAVILMLFFLYKWRTSSPVPSSSPFETNKHKYFSNETAYSDLDRRQTVEYSQSNQAFEPPDPYNKITEERSSSNEPAPDYPTREWETPQTRVLPHSSFT